MQLTNEEIEKLISDSYEIPNNVLEAVPNPMVTIRTSTYQHANYIKDCIEGVLMQKTTFPIEFIIGEDYSTDGTRKIVFEYAKKYPDIIRVFTANYNVGMKANGRRCIRASRGKYMALCEGDDYWTDPYKLQKQVDFLEENHEYSLCFHNAKIIYENNKRKPRPFVNLDKNIFTIEDVIERDWFIPTQSILFRKEYFNNIPEWYNYVLNGDLALQLILASKGNFYFINEIMSVYRKHDIGLSAQYLNSTVKLKIIGVLTYFNQYTHFEYHKPIQKRINTLRGELYKSLLYERKLINRLLNFDFYLFKLRSLLKNLNYLVTVSNLHKIKTRIN